jgi:tetratricopeptide (TPR) repeat protein
MTFRTDLPACVVALMLAMGALAPARADTLQDISKTLRQGQHAQALDQVDKYLAGKPKDAQGRFLKGLILTEMNKTSEAITVFQKLTDDYPELPEPYNNLAVIYAQQKQYDKAKQALEMAIRTHPSYATAHENLGDIYTRMASQAYDKALQIDSSNTSAQTKLAMIRDLMGARPAGAAGKPPVAVAAATQAKPAEPIKPPEPVKPAEAPKPVEPPKVAEQPKPVEPPKAIELSRQAAKPEPKPEAKPVTGGNGNVTTDVTRAVENWATAWSNKNVKGYLSQYARDFKTPNGESRSAWESERTQRINKPGPIAVSVDGLRVSAEGADKATARFRQHYKSANLKTSSSKTLVLVRQDGKWLIQQERVGN